MRLNIKTLAAAILMSFAGMAAQTQESGFVLGGAVSPGPAMQMKVGMMAMQVEDTDTTPVKGAPFCATVATEHTQLLSDGNRIHTADTSQLCRDSEGRTRRDAGLNLLGAVPQTSTPPRMITIVDPVAGVRYLLDTGSKVAHKIPLGLDPVFGGAASNVATATAAPGKGQELAIYRHSGGDSNVFFKNEFVQKAGGDSNETAPAKENLGDQTFDGIHATGTRVTTTIPAEKMGNEKPIVITSERWYSPELKAIVMTKHDDPWAGELKTQLKNVNASEPDPSFFTVPSDYTLVEDKDGPVRIKVAAPVPPPQ